MNKRALHKLDKTILALIFCFSIYTPFLAGVIQDDKIVSSVEKRNLTKFPIPPKSLKSLREYPENFNDYYSDHFGYREKFVKEYFKIINKFGVKKSVDDVTIGQEGWLFLGNIKAGYKRHNDPIGDAMNVNLFTEYQLKEFAKAIMDIKDWLGNRGINYIYVIAPNKHTIYSEYLPRHISKKNNKSSTDQLVEYLQEHTDVNVLDLRQALLDEKKKHPVYFKTDTHWNMYGANVAQFELMKKIKPFFPKLIHPFLFPDHQFKIFPKGGGDLGGFANIENIKEDNPQPIFQAGCSPVNETPDNNGRKTHTVVCDAQELNAVIFRDSFFSALQPYISRQFRRSTYIWEKINYNSLTKYVQQENPDIIIDEVIERSLPYIPSNDLFDDAK